MSAPLAVKIDPPNISYVWNKRTIYTNAIKKLNKEDMIFVVPVNYIDKEDPTKSVPSLIYISTWDSVFIFDLIMFKAKILPIELWNIIKSEKKKFVYSKQVTFTWLSINNWEAIPNVFDIESSGKQCSPYVGANLWGEGEASASAASTASTDIPVEINWRARPFKRGEHFKVGNRVYEIMKMFTDHKK